MNTHFHMKKLRWPGCRSGTRAHLVKSSFPVTASRRRDRSLTLTWMGIGLLLAASYPNKAHSVEALELGLKETAVTFNSAIEGTGSCDVFWTTNVSWTTNQRSLFRVQYEPTGGLSSKPVLDISSTGDTFSQWVVAFNDSGTGLMVWSGQHGLYSCRREAGGDWQAPVTISAGPSPFIVYAQSLGLGVDSSGNGLLTWADDNGNKVYSNRYIAGSGWTGSVPIGDRGSSRGALPFAMNSSGKAVLLWERWVGQWTLYASLFLPGQGWQPAHVLFTSPYYTTPAVTINEEGTIFATWLDGAFPGQTVYAGRMPAGQGWQPRVMITNTNLPRDPLVTINSNGDAVVIWRTAWDKTIAANRYGEGTGWRGVEVLSPIYVGDPVPGPSYFDDAGNIVCYWNINGEAGARFSSRRYVPRSGWMPVEELSFIRPINDGVVGSVGLKFHRNGLALATWTESWTVFTGEIYVNYTDFYAHRFSVALPSLKIGRSGNDSLVSWSALAEGYTLETASSLSVPTWTTVSNVPTAVGTMNHVTLLNTNGQAYYRLRR